MRKVFAALSLLLICQLAYSQATYYSIVNGGNWHDASTWSTSGFGMAAGSTVPGNNAGDIVMIGNGMAVVFTLENLGNATTIASIDLGDGSNTGILIFPFSNNGSINSNGSLTVTGNVTINNSTSGFEAANGGETINSVTVPGSGANRQHTLEIQGNFSMGTGIVDFQEDGGSDSRRVDLIFGDGASDQVISDGGTLAEADLHNIEFNNPGNNITITSDDFSNAVDEDVDFTAGTLIHNNSGSMVCAGNTGNTTASMSFDIQDGEFTLSSLTQDRTHSITGSLTLSGDAIFNSSTDTNGGTDAVGNLTLSGNLTMSGTSVFNVSSETGLPTIPANGADDGTLTLSGTTNVISGGTLLTEFLVLSTDADLDVDNATLYVGDEDGVEGAITLNDNVDVDLDDVTFSMVGDDIFMNNTTTFEINSNGGTTGTYDIAENQTGGTVINQTGTNASFVVGSATVNVAQNNGASPIFSLTGDGASITVNSGGTLDIYSTPDADGDIGIVIGAANNTVTVNGGDLNVGDLANNAGQFEYNASATNFNLNISNGGDVIVGEDFDDANTAALTSTVTITGSTSSLTIGDIAEFDDLSVTDGTLTVQSENAAGGNVTLRGTGTITNATVEFADGLTIPLNTASLTFNSGTLNIETAAATLSDTRLNLDGNFTQNGGTVNMATVATSQTGGNLIYIDDEVTFAINDGTFNVLSSLTDGALLTGGNGFIIDDTDNNGGGDDGDSDLIIGDGLNANATLNYAVNAGSSASIPNVDMLEVQGPNATVTIGTDGTVNFGASSSNTNGNVGRVLLDNTGSGEIAQSLTIDGTMHVAGDFTFGDGIDVTVGATGELNVGLNDSNGSNNISFGDVNGTGVDNVKRLTLNGGTINMGDGAAIFDTGNGNNSPPFSGIATYSSQLTINSGTLNVNGQFEVSDGHFIFTMSGGEININPQGINNLTGTSDVLFFNRGRVDITGGTITILNPHSSTGGGEAVHWNPAGDPGSGNELDVVNSSGWTLRFGDGTESLNGSVDGFDLDIDESWILPPITINNPSGTDRTVNFNGNSRNYVMDGSLTVTAGTLDMEGSSIDNLTPASDVFTLGDGANLIIGGTGNHFPGSATETPSAGTAAAFGTYTINSGSTVTYDGTTQTVDIPGTASFGDLVISGSATKTLSGAETVTDSLVLEAGVFSASTNLTLGSGATIVRSSGAFNTGDDIQGANDYSISYTGTSKSSAAEEYTGGGAFTAVTVNLNSGQTLTFHGAETVQDLLISEGTFADGGFSVTVNGDLTNNATHTGSGAIVLTGGSSAHTVSGDGTGSFTNLTLNDANGATVSTDLTVNGTLTLTSGVFDIGANLLSLTSSGTISAATPSSSTMIQLAGTTAEDGLTKTFGATNSGSPLVFPIGVGGKYTPASIELISATGLGDLTIKPIDGNTATTDPSEFEISYYWRLSSTISNPTATLIFTYADPDDVPGSANEAAFIPGRLSGATWTTIQDVNEVDDGTDAITFDNVDYITGDFTAAQPTEFGVIASYYSRTDGPWTNASTWSTDSFGGAAASTIPSNGQVVLIGNSNTVTLTADNQSAFSVEIQSTGTLTVDDGSTGHSFETVTGTGTLNIVSNSTTTPEFPGGVFSDFLNASGGTVSYSGTGSYTLPTQATYNNLNLTGSGNRTFPDADLTINGNLTVDNNGTSSFSDATSGDITVGGTLSVNDGTTTILQFPGTTARTISVTGDASVAANATLDVINSGSVTHSLQLGGGLTNSGTFDMNTGGSLVDVTFTGASNNAVSGSGATYEFNRLVVNKGTSQSNTLTLSSSTMTITSSAALDSKPIELQNGTLQIDNNLGTFDLTTDGTTQAARSFDIPATAGLTLNNASTTLQITSDVGLSEEGGDLALYGALTILDGTITIGDDATGVTDNELLYSGTASSFDMQGGSLTISGGFRVDRLRQTDTEVDATVIDFDISGGTLTTTRYRYARDGRNSTNNNNDINTTTPLSSSDEAGFEIANTSTFNMDGGTIVCVHGGAVNGNDDGVAFYVGSSVTGTSTAGTVQILNSNTPSVANGIAIASGVPLYNLNIGDGTTYAGDVGGVNTGEINMTVLNDFTLNLPSGEFEQFNVTGNQDDENFTLTIGNNFTITAGTFVGGADDTDADENDVIFNGTNHTIAITPTDALFHDITFDHSGTVTVNNNFRFNGDWTLNSGTVDLTTNTIDISIEENYNSANLVGENPTINGNATTFYDLTINGDGAATTNIVPTFNADVTVSNDLAINNDTINITTTTLTVNTITEDANSFIETSGLETDGGVAKSITLPSSFTYPLGQNGIARDVAFTGTGSGTDVITVIPVASQNVFASASQSLGVYWVITAGASLTPTDLDYTFNYDQAADINGTETSYVGATFDGANFTEETGTGDSFNDGSDNFVVRNSTTGSALQFLAGETGSFPPVDTYYSISSTCATGCDWTAASSWSTVSHAGAAAGSPPAANNPVVIANGDSVYVTTAGAVSATTQIDAGGVVHTTQIDNSGIGTLSGDGTFYVERDDDTNVDQGGGNEIVLPTLTAGVGTVHYYYSNGTNNFDLMIPATPTTYHNLSFSFVGDGNNPDWEIDNIDYTITGDLTVSDGDFNLIADASITSDGSGTFTLEGDADMNVAGANNFPSNFSTYTIGASGNEVRYTLNGEQTITTTANGGGTIAYGDVDLSTNNHVFTGTFDVNGLLDFTNGGAGLSLGSGTLNVGGDIDFSGQNSTSATGDPVLNAQTGTVVFDGGAAQTITGTGGYTGTDSLRFNNLTIEGASTAVTFPSFTGVYVADGTLTFSNDATLDLTSQDLVLNGDYTNNSSNVTPFTTVDELIFNNQSAAQTISGSSSVTLSNLTLQKAAGANVNITTPVTISGTLLMQNDGNIALSSGSSDHDLIISAGASLSDGNSNADWSSNRQIEYDGARTGNSDLIMTGTTASPDTYDFYFPVGTSGEHSPAQFDVSAVTGGVNETVIVKPVTGNASSVTIGGGTITNFDNSLATDRYFIVTNTATDLTGTFTFTYVDGDINGDEADYITRLWPGSGTAFEEPQTSGMVSTSSNVPASNQFGGSASTFIDDATTEWITGTNASFTPPLYSNGSGTWDNASTWYTTSSGTGGSTGIPTASTNVFIEDSDVITMPNNASTSILANTVDIGASATLDFRDPYDQAASSLTDVNGTGTIILDESPSLPATIDITDFLGSSGGTVNYNFSGDATERSLPSTISSYNNLTITDDVADDDATLQVNTTVNGDLTVDMAILNTSTFNLEVRGSITLSNGGLLDPSSGTLNLAGSSAQSIPSVVSSINNLILSNVGAKTLGAISVNDLTIFIGTGSVDGGTNTITIGGNWAGTSAFTQTGAGNVLFNAASGDQDISGTSSFHNIVVNKAANDVTLSGDITVSADITLTSGTINSGSQSITFSGTAATQGFLGTSSIALNDLIINKSAGTDFEYDTQVTSIGGDLTLTSGDFVSTGPTSLTIGGDFTLDANGSFNPGGVITSWNVGGNYIDNGGTMSLPANMAFNGSAAQTISTPLSFTNLTINNSAGVSTNSSQSVSGTLTLTDGVFDLDQDDGNRSDDPVLTIDPGTAISGTFGAGTHIEGRISTGGTTFTTAYEFPIGDAGIYHGVTLDPDGTADAFDIVQVLSETVPGDMATDLGGTTLPGQSGPIESFLTNLYWDINRSSGSGDVTVTLQLQASDGISMSDLSSIGIIRYNGSNWVSFDDPNLSSNAGNGTVTAVTSSFSEVGVTSDDVTENPLPVELISFQGEATDNNVILSWSTATELNNDRFEIQRSLDGVDFETLGSVAGNGTTNQLSHYSFNDKNPVNGFNFYRLKQVDFDGTEEMLPTIRISFDLLGSAPELIFYPNPTNGDNLSIQFLTNNPLSIVLRAIDLSGKILFEKQFENATTLNTNQISFDGQKGTFIVQVEQGGLIREHRVIVD